MDAYDELKLKGLEEYSEYRYYKGEAECPYSGTIEVKWWNFEKRYHDGARKSGDWKTFAVYLNCWVRDRAAPETGYDLSKGNPWIDEYMSNAQYITQKDYLKYERREARKDYRDRIEAQERIIKRHNELSGEIVQAETKEQLIEIIIIIDSWISILNDLKTENLFYLGDVPETYLTSIWADFVPEWKPNFEQLRDRAKFKADNMKQQSLKPQQIQKELQTDRAKALFQKAIAAGFVEHNENFYKWNGTRPELAFFSELASEYLKTLKYKPYEIAFGVNNLAQERWQSREITGKVSRQNEIESLFK